MNILAIDGGGIRGLIPALILRELERLHGRPICDQFGLLAGTSTGGILALGLVRPDAGGQAPAFSASALAKLYREDGGRIFPRRCLRTKLAMWRKERYPAEGLEEVLQEKFGDVRLSQALRPVIVPAVEIERSRLWMFRSRTAAEDGDWTMAAIARATSAAPTYFPPVQFPKSGSPNLAFVDGGLAANNPSLCAIAEAIAAGANLDEIHLTSIGTGAVRHSVPYRQAKAFGLVNWARPLTTLLMSAPADAVDYQCRKLLGDRYRRWQVPLPAELGALDDASEANLDGLSLCAEAWIAANGEQLN